MISWSIIISVVCVLLLLFLLYKEYKRQNTDRRGWRLLATILAIVGLAGMGLPLNYYRSVPVQPEKSFFLLTEGYNSDTLGMLLNNAKSNYSIYSDIENPKTGVTYQQASLNKISSLIEKEKSHYRFHVLGYGLSQNDLALLDSHKVEFHPAQLPEGVTSVYWPAKTKSGDKLQVQGTFNNTQSAPVKIVLSSFNAVLDSITIPAKSLNPFSLSTVPKQLGRAEYFLTVINKKDTVVKEPIPFEVIQATPLRVLILATAPDFENKFLKNWLGENGHTVAVKTAISTNKTDQSLLNAANLSANQISSSYLSNFDIVKADASWFGTVSNATSNVLLSAVASNKTGLMISVDSMINGMFYTKRFPLTNNTSNTRQLLNLQLSDTSISLPPLPVESQFIINNPSNNQAVVSDNKNRVYVSSNLYNAGNILLTTISNTYSWYLAGHHAGYANFWTHVLQKAAAKKESDEVWSVTPFLPKINEPVLIKVQTNQPGVTTAFTGSSSIHLKNKATLPYSWNGCYWPSNTGWQPTVQFNGEIFWWYAYDKQHWKTVDAFEKMQATAQFAERNKRETTEPLKDIKRAATEIPKIYFFVMLLFAAAFLWYEKKLIV